MPITVEQIDEFLRFPWKPFDQRVQEVGIMGEPVEGIRDAGAMWSQVAQRVIDLLDRAEAQGFWEVEFELFGVAKKIKIHLPPKAGK